MEIKITSVTYLQVSMGYTDHMQRRNLQSFNKKFKRNF